jgi:hypothetical protein
MSDAHDSWWNSIGVDIQKLRQAAHDAKNAGLEKAGVSSDTIKKLDQAGAVIDDFEKGRGEGTKEGVIDLVKMAPPVLAVRGAITIGEIASSDDPEAAAKKVAGEKIDTAVNVAKFASGVVTDPVGTGIGVGKHVGEDFNKANAAGHGAEFAGKLVGHGEVIAATVAVTAGAGGLAAAGEEGASVAAEEGAGALAEDGSAILREAPSTPPPALEPPAAAEPVAPEVPSPELEPAPPSPKTIVPEESPVQPGLRPPGEIGPGFDPTLRPPGFGPEGDFPADVPTPFENPNQPRIPRFPKLPSDPFEPVAPPDTVPESRPPQFDPEPASPPDTVRDPTPPAFDPAPAGEPVASAETAAPPAVEQPAATATDTPTERPPSGVPDEGPPTERADPPTERSPLPDNPDGSPATERAPDAAPAQLAIDPPNPFEGQPPTKIIDPGAGEPPPTERAPEAEAG